MAWFGAGVGALLLNLPTLLLATSYRVFTVAGAVAFLFACMRATLEFLTANKSTSSIDQPTRLILEHLLSA